MNIRDVILERMADSPQAKISADSLPRHLKGNRVGSAFAHLSHSGLFRRERMKRSSDPAARGRMIGVWSWASPRAYWLYRSGEQKK